MTLDIICSAALVLAACFIVLLIVFDQGEKVGAKRVNAARDAFEAQSARIAQRFEELEREALAQQIREDAENRQTDAIEALIAHAAKQALKLQETTKAFERYEGASLDLRSKHYQDNASVHAEFYQVLESHRQRLCKLDALETKCCKEIDSHSKYLENHAQCIESQRQRLCTLETEFQHRVGAL